MEYAKNTNNLNISQAPTVINVGTAKGLSSAALKGALSILNVRALNTRIIRDLLRTSYASYYRFIEANSSCWKKAILVTRFICYTVFQILLFCYVRKIRANIIYSICDHTCYFVGGALETSCCAFGIPYFHNMYPYSLCLVLPNRNSFPIQYRKLAPLPSEDLGKDYKYLNNNPRPVPPYMNRDIKQPRSLDSSVMSDCSFVIYAHSFTDAQNHHGWDGAFLNVYDWLSFSVRQLSMKKIIIKAHPNFYSTNHDSDVCKRDREIFEKFISSHSQYLSNSIIINYELNNDELLSCLSPDKTTLLTHHGTVLFDAIDWGFAAYASHTHPLFEFFCSSPVIRFWSDKHSYLELLEQRPGSRAAEDVDTSSIINPYLAFMASSNSAVSTNSWRNLIERFCGMPDGMMWTKPLQLQNYLCKLNQKDIDELVSLLSASVWARG